MKSINKEKVLSTIIAIFIIQFGIFFIIREADKKYGNHEVEKLRLEKLFGIKFNDNLQPKVANLNLCCKNWSEIPPELLTFTNVEIINLSKNKFTQFPYELLEMPNLVILNLNDNQIQEIDCQQKNKTLFNLLLNNNQIQTIENIAYLEGLEVLRLNNNQIEVLNDNFSKNLEYLNLYKNNLKKIDSNIDFKSKKLLELNLSFNNNLHYIPNNLLEMSHLRKLNLENCKLEKWEIKEGIVNQKLSQLLLSFNQLTNFKTDDKQLPNLRQLALKENRLSRVNIKHSNIDKLYLAGNKLTTSGLSLDLPLAKIVNLYDNELKSLPEECLIAPNLEKLNLNKNYITNAQGKDIWYRFPKLIF